MTDPTFEIRMQVMWNRLISVVEEQAMTLLRTAFSTSVREAGDLSAGVFDPAGRMLAQAVTGTPGHVNTMAEAVLHFIAEIGPENMFPGDTYVTNDPWKGTGHLHDITMVSPSFLGDRLAGYAYTYHLPSEVREERCYIFGEVSPDLRRRGVGTALASATVSVVRASR